MKNVLVLGATGKVGQLIVKKLNENTEIKQTLYVRNLTAQSFGDRFNGLIVEGDVLDEFNLSKVMKNQDIVAASLNGDLLSQAKSIVNALKNSNVRKVIWITGLGIHREVPGEIGKFLDTYLEKYPEYAQAADTIAESGVSYTLLRCAGIVDGESVEYHITNEGEPIRSEIVTKAAIAKCISDMLLDEEKYADNNSLGITN